MRISIRAAFGIFALGSCLGGCVVQPESGPTFSDTGDSRAGDDEGGSGEHEAGHDDEGDDTEGVQSSDSGSQGEGETSLDADDIANGCDPSAPVDAGVTKLRRLTRQQLDNTLWDLLGIAPGVARTLSPDERIGPFHSNAIAPVTELLVQQLQELAVRVAAEVEPRMAELAPCDLEAGGAACAAQFVEDFGRRAFRRPLVAAETEGLVALYQLAAEAGGPSHGFRRVVEAILQSPSFLYHSDIGASEVPTATPERLENYSLAARLSYFLWNSMPDDELFELAAEGALVDPSTLAEQAARLLQDPRSERTVALFHRQWLALEGLEEVTKDPALYPQFNEGLAEVMLEESDRFVQHVVMEGDGLLRTLLTAPYTFPDDGLFELYGITRPPTFSVGDRVELDPSQRSGILTFPAFLTKQAHSNQTSPIHRGIIIRENVMCQPIPPPPPNVAGSAPPPDEITSTRERFAQHVADPTCAGCHMLIDPPGLAFEHYDAIGAYREIDGLGPVDASGEIINAEGALAGPFDGAVELAGKLAESPQVMHCVASQWFRFGLGRLESDADTCSLQTIQQRFTASDGNIRELMTQIVLSDAFTHVRSTATE